MGAQKEIREKNRIYMHDTMQLRVYCKKMSHFYGFMFIHNSLLLFRWSQKSSICTLKWAEVLILFFFYVNTFMLRVHVFFMTIAQTNLYRRIWQKKIQIISILFSILQPSITHYDHWHGCVGGVCCTMYNLALRITWLRFKQVDKIITENRNLIKFKWKKMRWYAIR